MVFLFVCSYLYFIDVKDVVLIILIGDYRSLIMIEGGVDLILVAMKTHLVSVDINVAACKTLSNLGMLRGINNFLSFPFFFYHY